MADGRKTVTNKSVPAKVSNDFDPGISHPYYFMRKGLIKAIKKWAPELKGRLLDFGCGSKPYKPLFTVDEYIGLDFEKTGHDHSNEQIDVFYDGKSIPFPDNSFDSVLCSEVAEHLFDLPMVLEEIKRVIKPGGKILMTTPFVWPEHETPYDFARYSRFGLEDVAKKCGLEIYAFEKEGNFLQAVTQLKVLYFAQWAQNGLFKLSFFGRAIFGLIVAMKNTSGRLKSAVFPANHELYLTNVVLLQKK
jgi:SAM-dependent methyltransferase